MEKLKNFVIVTQEVADAILDFKYHPLFDTEMIIDVYIPYTAGDLDENGLPKASLTGKQLVPVMEETYSISSLKTIELNDGRIILSKEAVRHLWDKMLRPYNQGGLQIGAAWSLDPDDVANAGANPTGARSVKDDASDFFPVKEGDPLYDTIVSEIKPED